MLRSYRKLKARRNKYLCQNCKDQSWIIECQCLDPDCHEVLTRFDRWHTERSTIKGHYPKKRQSHRKANGWINKDGYRMIWIFDEERKKLRRVLEHRYVYEQYYNIKLKTEELLHHKDGNKLNNNVFNLHKMNFEDHSSMHNTKNKE